MRKIVITLLFPLILFLIVGCSKSPDINPDNDLTKEELVAFDDFQEIKVILGKNIPNNITNDIKLEYKINDYYIVWETSDHVNFTYTGKVTRTTQDNKVTLKASLRDYKINDFFIKEVTIRKKGFKDMGNKKLTFAYLYDHSVSRKEDYNNIDVINYSFGHIKNGKLSLHERPQIKEFVRVTHNYGVKVVLAIGGWGSGGFSEAAMTKETRKVLIDSIVEAVIENDLDGIDFDWEYPTTGVAGIKFSPKDKENFTSLVKETREALDNYKEGLILSSAFPGGTWAINLYYEVKELNKYLDYFHLMTYDVETQNKASHHTSLHTSKGALTSVEESVNGYIKSGVDANKIVVGGAFYGKKAKFDTKTTNPLGKYAIWNGTIIYSNLKRDYLDKYPDNIYYDDIAKASYYFDGINFITYDDVNSLTEKAEFVTKNNLAGMMFWSLSGDNSGTLVDSINKTLKK